MMTFSGKPSSDFFTTSFLISGLYLMKHITLNKHVVSQHQPNVENQMGHCVKHAYNEPQRLGKVGKRVAVGVGRTNRLKGRLKVEGTGGK